MNNVPNVHDSSEASSSSHSPPGRSHTPRHDETDAYQHDANVDEVLDEDPLKDNFGAPRSFKRKQKRSLFDFAQPSRLFTTFTGSSGPRPRGGNRSGASYGNGALGNDHSPLENLGDPQQLGTGGANENATFKDGGPLDWYVEGPGRRVGYEDLTAIDWIFEYTKERTRLRVLRATAQGLLGKIQLALDTTQEWVILVLTGMLVGTLAAIIDITTDWLGDLKAGYCTRGDGGRFYLNKSFCCMGYDEGAQCLGWRPWATALNISSTAGGWVIEYFFFIMFSV